MYVYLLENTVTGKRYVGQTCMPLRKRFRSHLSQARNDARLKSPLKSAFLKYGAGAFRMTLLGEYGTQSETDTAEAHFIRALNTIAPYGYNLRHGGLTGGHTEESRAKLCGIKRSEATRAKLRQIVKTPEWRARLGEARRGKPAHPDLLAGAKRARERPWSLERRQRQQGEGNPHVLLSEEQVRAVRRRYAAGGVSQQRLAEEYAVKQVTISAIVRRRTWRHLAD